MTKKTLILERKLPKEVAEKYNLKSIRAGKYVFPKFGEIDLRTITLKQADELVKKGFPFLVLKKKDLSESEAEAKAKAKAKAEAEAKAKAESEAKAKAEAEAKAKAEAEAKAKAEAEAKAKNKSKNEK